MRLSELCYMLEAVSKDSDLEDPEVFIRMGGYQAPLLEIKIIYENDNFFESIILQDKCYKDVLM